MWASWQNGVFCNLFYLLALSSAAQSGHDRVCNAVDSTKKNWPISWSHIQCPVSPTITVTSLSLMFHLMGFVREISPCFRVREGNIECVRTSDGGGASAVQEARCSAKCGLPLSSNWIVLCWVSSAWISSTPGRRGGGGGGGGDGWQDWPAWPALLRVGRWPKDVGPLCPPEGQRAQPGVLEQQSQLLVQLGH